MKIEVLRFKDTSGREGSRAPMGSGLAKLYFDNGDVVLVRLPQKEMASEGKTVIEHRFVDSGTLEPEGMTNLRMDGDYPLITLGQISNLVEALRRGKGLPRFAVLMFIPKNSEDGEYVNLQYSFELGAVGLDWVLAGGRNIEEQDTIAAFARWRGHEVKECEMNGVRYLRVEGAGIEDLGLAVMTEVYGFEPSCQVKLLVEGFDWPEGA